MMLFIVNAATAYMNVFEKLSLSRNREHIKFADSVIIDVAYTVRKILSDPSFLNLLNNGLLVKLSKIAKAAARNPSMVNE